MRSADPCYGQTSMPPFHVYGLSREEVEHVLDSFFVVRKYDERDYVEYRTKRLVLDAYDRMASAIANGGSAAP